MKIVRDYIIQKGNVYDEWGGLIEPNRFSSNLPSHYWQQAHHETTLSIDYNTVKESCQKIKPKAVIYIGGVSMHMGHFLLESLQKFIDVYSLPSGIPVVLNIGPGMLPKGIKHMPMKDVKWLLKTFIKNEFETVKLKKKKEGLYGDIVYIPEKYVQLSSNCEKPYMFNKIIKIIVEKARKKSKVKPSDNVFLSRYETKKIPKGFEPTDPHSRIYDQIAMVSYAKELRGDIGSNTHLVMFAQAGCKCTWTQNRRNSQGFMNQTICDMIKSFNTFNGESK